jgi:hypothetical protein
VPSAVRLNTFAASSSASILLASRSLQLAFAAICFGVIGSPFTVRWPTGSPSCIAARHSIQNPRAARLQARKALSLCQSRQQNFDQ